MQNNRQKLLLLNVVVIVVLIVALIVTLHRTSTPVSSVAAPTIHLTTASTEFFIGGAHSQLNCELDDAAFNMDTSYKTVAYCQSVTPARSVSMGGSGVAKACEGENCIGNPGLGTPIFSAGMKVILGPFTCTLGSNWVSCSNAHHSFTLYAVAKKPTTAS